jgi:3'-phosphoadenosine 5'-phosphosulfate sulfotransferase (PAPS reductase)/FAD synthetase
VAERWLDFNVIMELKISAAHRVINQVLAHYKRPALMCSFGKDSMVLLHLLREMGCNLPIVFHRDPWFPSKYAFAEAIIQDWQLEVHDYPPSAVTLWEKNDIVAFTNHYQIGPRRFLHLPKNILPPEEGKKWLCGLREVLGRPTGAFNYPFDVAFIGHKSSDKDQMAGSVTLHTDIKQNAGTAPDGAFPLRHWTDADVWDYTERFNVPQQRDRYDVGGKCERSDKEHNSDYAHVCIACIDRREKAVSVQCPRLGMQVTNVSAEVPYTETCMSYYGEEAKPCSK